MFSNAKEIIQLNVFTLLKNTLTVIHVEIKADNWGLSLMPFDSACDTPTTPQGTLRLIFQLLLLKLNNTDMDQIS